MNIKLHRVTIRFDWGVVGIVIRLKKFDVSKQYVAYQVETFFQKQTGLAFNTRLFGPLFAPTLNRGGPIFNKLTLLQRFLSISVALFALSSCCPKEGVDKSVHYNDMNITLELTNLVKNTPITYLDYESRVEIILKNKDRLKGLRFDQSTASSNRFTFYFPDNTPDADIDFLDVKLIDYKDIILDYNKVKKTAFQKDAELIALTKDFPFFCRWSPFDLILPKANAMSCPTKKGSVRTFRPGQLIILGLYPEDL